MAPANSLQVNERSGGNHVAALSMIDWLISCPWTFMVHSSSVSGSIQSANIIFAAARSRSATARSKHLCADRRARRAMKLLIHDGKRSIQSG